MQQCSCFPPHNSTLLQITVKVMLEFLEFHRCSCLRRGDPNKDYLPDELAWRFPSSAGFVADYGKHG
jgi:hypothetical protein